MRAAGRGRQDDRLRRRWERQEAKRRAKHIAPGYAVTDVSEDTTTKMLVDKSDSTSSDEHTYYVPVYTSIGWRFLEVEQ
jgi:hypothetical protein